jgi:hypothetical protein
MYQLFLTGGNFSRCETTLTWLKKVNLFRSSVLVKRAERCECGPRALDREMFSQVLMGCFPEHSFLRNLDGHIPEVVTFDGRKRFTWSFNPAFERLLGLKASDFSSDSLASMKFG